MKWEGRERRAMIVMAAGAIFYAGWVSSAAYFNIAGRWQDQNKLVHVETHDVPKLKTALKQANCDKTHLASIAGQAIAANESPDLDGPSWAELHGCAPVVPIKPPSVATILKK